MLLRSYVKLRNKLSSKKGQGFVEYLILIVLVAIGVIGAILLFRDEIFGKLGWVTEEIGRMH